MGGAVVTAVTSQEEGSRFEPCGDQGLVYPCVRMGSLWVLRLPPTAQRRACENR